MTPDRSPNQETNLSQKAEKRYVYIYLYTVYN